MTALATLLSGALPAIPPPVARWAHSHPHLQALVQEISQVPLRGADLLDRRVIRLF